jgi:hypothetical protein
MTTTTQATWATPLAAALAQAGISTNAADVLSQYYPGADPAAFVDGLGCCAQALMTLLPPTGSSAEEPWATLLAAIANVAQGDMEDTFQTALAPLAPELQGAIADAVRERMAALQTAQAKQAARRRRAKSTEYLKALSGLGYGFRMNDLNDVIEVNGKPISDALAAQIRVQMRDHGFEYVNVMEDVYMAEAYNNRFNPVLEYLDGLQYDGGQHIAALAAHFKDKDGVFPIWLKRWLIGAVAKARCAEQNPMLVLDGFQDMGKSTFVRWLGSGLPDYFSEAPINLEDKDSYIRMCSTFVWEVSEFGATIRRADREALKSFLTTRTIKVRRPYGRHDIIKPALASFIATVNNESGILSDPTGNRRFLIACVTSIDWTYTQTLDPNQVWAEANALYLAGEPWRLETTERQRREEINERYEVEDPIEGLLKKYFQVDPGNATTWTSTVDILTQLEDNGLRGGGTRQNSMALASVATKLRLTKRKGYTANGQRSWGYEGVEKI